MTGSSKRKDGGFDGFWTWRVLDKPMNHHEWGSLRQFQFKKTCRIGFDPAPSSIFFLRLPSG